MTSSGTASLGAAPLVGLSYDVGAGSGFSVSLTTEFLTIDFAVMVASFFLTASVYIVLTQQTEVELIEFEEPMYIYVAASDLNE